MILALFFAATTITGFAQTSSFDKKLPLALKSHHAMRNANPVNGAQILKNLDELTASLKVLSDTYLDNPPAEYAKDVK